VDHTTQPAQQTASDSVDAVSLTRVERRPALACCFLARILASSRPIYPICTRSAELHALRRLREPMWIGWTTIAHVDDSVFASRLETFYYTALAVPIVVVVAMVLALR